MAKKYSEQKKRLNLRFAGDKSQTKSVDSTLGKGIVRPDYGKMPIEI